MKQMIITLVAALVVFLAAGFTIKSLKSRPIELKGGTPMQIISSAFADGQDIPAKYTCDGDNINPPLSFADIPINTKSLALVLDDPDSPSGNFVHWLVWNIPPDTASIAEDSTPPTAVIGTTSFNKQEYGGPCPSIGKHHYQFKVYALDTTLELPATTSRTEFDQAIYNHILGQGSLTGLYIRQ